MEKSNGRTVFSRRPIKSVHFWLGSLFITVASLPVIWILVRHGNSVSPDALRWLLLGLSAVWLYLIRIWIAHQRLFRYLSRTSAVDENNLVIEQAYQLAYIGLTLVAFATLGFMMALWRIAGTVN
jgi:hypothetical protein